MFVHWLLAHPLLVSFIAEPPKQLQSRKVSEKLSLIALLSLCEYIQHKCSHSNSQKVCPECHRFYCETQKRVRECCQSVLDSGYDISLLNSVDEHIKYISIFPERIGVVYDYPIPCNVFYLDSCRLFIDLVINCGLDVEEQDIESYLGSTNQWYPFKAYHKLVAFSQLDPHKPANNPPKVYNYRQYCPLDHHGGLINFQQETKRKAIPGQRAHPDAVKIPKCEYFPFLKRLSAFTDLEFIDKKRNFPFFDVDTSWKRTDTVHLGRKILGAENSISLAVYKLSQEIGKYENAPNPSRSYGLSSGNSGQQTILPKNIKSEPSEPLHQSPTSPGMPPLHLSKESQPKSINQFVDENRGKKIKSTSRNIWQNPLTTTPSLRGSMQQSFKNTPYIPASSQSPPENFDEPPKKIQKLSNNLPLSFQVMQEPKDNRQTLFGGKQKQVKKYISPKRKLRKLNRKFRKCGKVPGTQKTHERIPSKNTQSLMKPLQSSSGSAMQMLLRLQPSENLEQILRNMQRTLPVLVPPTSGVQQLSSEPKKQLLKPALFNIQQPLGSTEGQQNLLQQPVDDSQHDPFTDIINNLQEYIETTTKRLAESGQSVDSSAPTNSELPSATDEAAGSDNSQHGSDNSQHGSDNSQHGSDNSQYGSDNSQQSSGSTQQTQLNVQEPTSSTEQTQLTVQEPASSSEQTESPFSAIIEQLQQFIGANSQTATQ